jgi:hypothetical protein
MSKRKINKKNYTVMIPIMNALELPKTGFASIPGYPIKVENGKAKVPQEIFNIIKMTAKSRVEEEFGFELVIDDGDSK